MTEAKISNSDRKLLGSINASIAALRLRQKNNPSEKTQEAIKMFQDKKNKIRAKYKSAKNEGGGAGVRVALEGDVPFQIKGRTVVFTPTELNLKLESYDKTIESSENYGKGVEVKLDDITDFEKVEEWENEFGSKGEVSFSYDKKLLDPEYKNQREIILSGGWVRSKYEAGDAFNFGFEADQYGNIVIEGTATFNENGEYAWQDLDNYDDEESQEESLASKVLESHSVNESKRTVKVYYQETTPESAEDGDWSDTGEEDEFDIEDGLQGLRSVTSQLMSKYGSVEPSSSSFHKGVWYTTIDPDRDYKSGAEKYYTIHFKGVTPEEEKAVYDFYVNDKKIEVPDEVEESSDLESAKFIAGKSGLAGVYQLPSGKYAILFKSDLESADRKKTSIDDFVSDRNIKKYDKMDDAKKDLYKTFKDESVTNGLVYDYNEESNGVVVKGADASFWYESLESAIEYAKSATDMPVLTIYTADKNEKPVKAIKKFKAGKEVPVLANEAKMTTKKAEKIVSALYSKYGNGIQVGIFDLSKISDPAEKILMDGGTEEQAAEAIKAGLKQYGKNNNESLASKVLESYSDYDEVIADKIKQMEQGKKVVVSDEQYDAIIEATTDHEYSLKLASIPNPNSVGTKDRWLAFFKGISPNYKMKNKAFSEAFSIDFDASKESIEDLKKEFSGLGLKLEVDSNNKLTTEDVNGADVTILKDDSVFFKNGSVTLKRSSTSGSKLIKLKEAFSEAVVKKNYPEGQGMNTLWGKAQQAYLIKRGVMWVSTAGHGGLMVSETVAHKELSPKARKYATKFGNYYCYEEDSQWAVAMYEHPEWSEGIFSKTPDKEQMKKSIERDYPNFFDGKEVQEAPQFKTLKVNDILTTNTSQYGEVRYQVHEVVSPSKIKVRRISDGALFILSKSNYSGIVTAVERGLGNFIYQKGVSESLASKALNVHEASSDRNPIAIVIEKVVSELGDKFTSLDNDDKKRTLQAIGLSIKAKRNKKDNTAVFTSNYSGTNVSYTGDTSKEGGGFTKLLQDADYKDRFGYLYEGIQEAKPNWAPEHAIWFQKADDGNTTAYVSRVNDKYTYEIFDKYGKTLKKEHGVPSLSDAKKLVFDYFGSELSEDVSAYEDEVKSAKERLKAAQDKLRGMKKEDGAETLNQIKRAKQSLKAKEEILANAKKKGSTAKSRKAFMNKLISSNDEALLEASIKDDVLAGITLEDLITTLQANEPKVDPAVVKRVYNEILAANKEDAEHVLKTKMDFIIDQADVSESDVTSFNEEDRPPKEWFDKMKAEIKKGNPDYSDEQVNATVGKIWYKDLSNKKQKQITKRDESVSSSARVERVGGKKHLITDKPLLADISPSRLKQLDTIELYRMKREALDSVAGFDDATFYSMKNIFTEKQMQDLLAAITPELADMEKRTGGQGAYYKKLSELADELTDALDTNESLAAQVLESCRVNEGDLVGQLLKIGAKDKGVSTKEMLKIWEDQKPHFYGTMPHRYQAKMSDYIKIGRFDTDEKVCVYCCKPQSFKKLAF